MLKYTGRILPADNVEVVGSMTGVMKDLTGITFCVPVMWDRDNTSLHNEVCLHHRGERIGQENKSIMSKMSIPCQKNHGSVNGTYF